MLRSQGEEMSFPLSRLLVKSSWTSGPVLPLKDSWLPLSFTSSIMHNTLNSRGGISVCNCDWLCSYHSKVNKTLLLGFDVISSFFTLTQVLFPLRRQGAFSLTDLFAFFFFFLSPKWTATLQPYSLLNNLITWDI